jgi:hypothetical protein
MDGTYVLLFKKFADAKRMKVNDKNPNKPMKAALLRSAAILKQKAP